MLSRNITLHYGDNPHLIFDKSTATYRDGKGGVSVGAHVWIGEGVYLSKNAQIPQESIVAARSVVSRSFSQPHILIGGNPAQVLREDIQWFRNRHHIPPGSSFEASIAEYDTHVLRSNPQRLNESNNTNNFKNTSVIGHEINNNGNFPDNTTLLFCIGAMKAGTTWLYDYLKKNNDVYFRNVKEIHYFDVIKLKSEESHFKRRADQLKRAAQKLHDGSIRDVNNNLDHIDNIIELLELYRKPYNNHYKYINYLTKGHTGQKIVGDVTPSYSSLNADIFREMSMIAQDVKFIFIIRDPVQRLWSAIRMRAREINSDKNIVAACEKIFEELVTSFSKGNPHPMLKRSDYKSTIEHLDDSVTEKNLFYVFYEDLFTNAGTKEICDFLRIHHHAPDSTHKINIGVPVDISDSTARVLRSMLANQYEFLSARFGERAYKLE